MRRMRVWLLAVVAVQALCTVGHAAEESGAVERLHALFAEAWEQDLEDDPRGASYLGDKRFNARWADHSPEAWARRNERYGELLANLGRIPREELPSGEQLNYDLFQRLYRDRIEQYRFDAHLRAIDQLNYSQGVLTANAVTEVVDFSTVRDFEDWIARLQGMGAYIDQTIELLHQGIATRNTQPRIIMDRVLKQLQAQLVDDPTASPFYAPFTRIPATIGDQDRSRLTSAAQEAIRTTVVPAYRRLDRFLSQEYLPACRETVGIWDTPEGEAFYRSRVEWFTTTSLSPEEIHTLGLEEVARIRGEMLGIIEQVGFEGGFDRFLEHLRTDPKFRYTSGDELLTAYLAMSKRIDPLLTEFFGKLPRIPYGVRPIPATNAPDTTTAYYQPPSVDGRRPGYYYVNLYRPEERPIYEIPVLTVHEAVPGHHLQIALARELGELPEFRRHFEATAYVEGWALYAESLGDEMDLYSDPYDKFGQLTYEMWRAVRLVVDTGIHHKRWSRERAIEFFKANAAKSELDIVNEIDRYIAWPGQALAYKVGELKFKELRRRAAERLGENFDLRAFHDLVLGTGAVPLDVLERTVDEWLAQKSM